MSLSGDVLSLSLSRSGQRTFHRRSFHPSIHPSTNNPSWPNNGERPTPRAVSKTSHFTRDYHTVPSIPDVRRLRDERTRSVKVVIAIRFPACKRRHRYPISSARRPKVDDENMGSTSLQDLKSKKFWVAVLAEFVGTALLVLVACGSCLSKTDPDLNSKVTRISLAFGLSVGSIVWAICNVSGGHINPAVTFGFFVTRKVSIVRFLLYVVFQTLGAIVGAGILKVVTPSDYVGTLATSDTSTGASIGQVFGIELLITFVFVFTVLATCDGQRKDLQGSGPLAIGLTIAMCHLWAVPYSGSGMNPARVFGPAVVSGSWNNHWAYWVGPLVGGAVGALLYDFVFAVNATPVKFRGCFSRRYDDADYDNSGLVEDRNNQVMALKEAA